MTINREISTYNGSEESEALLEGIITHLEGLNEESLYQILKFIRHGILGLKMSGHSI
jgi:hypothetical protein